MKQVLKELELTVLLDDFNCILSCVNIFNNYSTRARWISNDR